MEKQDSKANETKESILSKVDYVENSTDEQWNWMTSNLDGFKSFSKQAEVFAAVLQRVKKLPQFTEDLLQNIAKLFGQDNIDEVLKLLFKEPWNANQMESVKDVLKLRPRSIRPNEHSFTDSEKDKFLGYIETSVAQNWEWMKMVPQGIHLFSMDAEILTSVLLTLETIRKGEIQNLVAKHMTSDVALTLKEEESLVSVLCKLRKLESKMNDLLSNNVNVFSPIMKERKYSLAFTMQQDSFSPTFQEIKETTQEYIHDVIWTCYPPTDFNKYNQCCGDHWIYGNIHHLDERKTDCVVIFGIESLANSALSSKQSLSLLFSKVKCCLVLVTDEEVLVHRFHPLCIFEDFQIQMNSSLMDVMKKMNISRLPNLKTLKDRAKTEMIQYITESAQEKWDWLNENSFGIQYFFGNVEVLEAVIQKAESLNLSNVIECHQKLDQGKSTILHKLSAQPLSNDQVSSVMDFLVKGVNPNQENHLKKTFLEFSPIKRRLSVRITAADDNWIKYFWNKDNTMIKNWISLGDDDLLVEIFIRMSTYLSQRDLPKEKCFNPITIAREMWSDQSNLPHSFKEFLLLTARYYSYDPLELKKVCKLSLKNDVDNGKPDIALPVFQALKKFSAEGPSFGYYIKEAFKSLTWLTLIMRSIDGITDISLTITYSTTMETVLQDFLNDTLCHQQSFLNNSNCSNVDYVIAMCQSSSEDIPKLICGFTLMKWWIPGVLSAAALTVTYLAEVISSMVKSKQKDKANQHYLELYSKVCCQKHNQITIFAYRFILPLTQQISGLVYENWVKSFVRYWKEKNKELILSGMNKIPGEFEITKIDITNILIL